MFWEREERSSSRGAIGAARRDTNPEIVKVLLAVLVELEGAVELVEQGSGGIPLFHEAAKDDEAAGAELAVTWNNLGALMGATK